MSTMDLPRNATSRVVQTTLSTRFNTKSLFYYQDNPGAATSGSRDTNDSKCAHSHSSVRQTDWPVRNLEGFAKSEESDNGKSAFDLSSTAFNHPGLSSHLVSDLSVRSNVIET